MRTRILGLFFSRDPLALRGLSDAPYRLLGRHALCGERACADGGASASIWGRLRNARALREKIERAGGKLRPDADDSVLALSAYRLWGEDMARRIEGPVCAAVLDRDAGKLLLIRDRMGEQPLFYASVGGSVAFSDRPEALLPAPGVTSAVDRDGLCELFALGPARTPGRTPFRDIREVPPGQMLVATEFSIRQTPYFSLDAHEHEDDERKTAETVRSLLEEAIREALPLHPACMLSGGLDSSVVLALSASLSGEPPVAFTVDYEEDDRYFESTSYRPERDAPYAKMASEAIGARQICIELSVSALADALEDAMLARGFPGMADIDSSMLLFARSISARAGSVWMGECADEAFGGYPWFHREDLLAREGFPWSGSLPLRESVLRPELRKELHIAKYADTRYHEACADLPVLSCESEEEARLRRLQGLTFRFFMPNLQERAERMCGAAGVTPLTPFCDDRLIRYLYNVPWRIKNLGGVPKGLLREACRGLLPEALLTRKKSPYPKVCHPRYVEILRGRVFALAEDRRAPLWSVCDRESVLKLAAARLSPSETPWYGQLMAGPQLLAYLLQVDLWMRAFRVEPELS